MPATAAISETVPKASQAEHVIETSCNMLKYLRPKTFCDSLQKPAVFALLMLLVL